MIRGNRQASRDASVIKLLIFEREPAALRVVEPGDALLQHAALLEIVREAVNAAGPGHVPKVWKNLQTAGPRCQCPAVSLKSPEAWLPGMLNLLLCT